ncbi:dual specificity phosphatase DUPD1, putative [Entamoeba invadens IP1]|uniref:dual specificity phosphatase DUPD1, putative n=1 Tax=Entamoeba invadens IP1 TaxID=370355 RepID=UPI0002C3CEF2|nr:dual specificity phosphatase DUPD1, putative [Entamoeba invadens IP1]ELP94043.1 dual specificity phosphatase DUPD1, putative [Entamoeba invadens IP1]|eukprot:XP_004260814.1 dual specificity phosphatase DUPD1, putative [Entamoeba invadens IP1]
MLQVGIGINASKKKLTDNAFQRFISCHIKQHKITANNVKTIIATLNHITVTPALKYMTTLNTLDLSENKITDVTNEVLNWTSLTLLNLSHNKITNADFIFQMTSLKSLNLSYNSITTIPSDLKSLSNLTELNLGWNQLTDFDYECMNGLKSIQRFDVTANRITTVKHTESLFYKTFGTPFAQVLPNEIAPHLYLGSMEATVKPTLRELKIHAVLSIGVKPLYNSKKVIYLYIPCGDTPTDNIAQHFSEAFEFIDQYISEEKNVLVHCVAGVSRSASIVISYIMKKMKMTFPEAFQTVKDKRLCVCPNPGFTEQLQKFKPK